MTPEDTPRMAERTDRQTQTDPWAQVKRFHVQPRPDDPKLVRHVGAGPGQPEGFYMWAQYVDAARAADAAQLAHMAANQLVLQDAVATQSDLIASLTAQLDQKTAEVEMLRGVGCNEDGDGPCGACLKCARAERDALYCERGDLKELHTEAREDAVSWRMECVKAERERDAAQQESKRWEVHYKMKLLAEMEEFERAERAEQEAQTLREALTRLRDCDWTIGRGDRMDAVRDIARAALAPRPPEPQ